MTNIDPNYSYHREEVIKNLLKYSRGQLKGKELDNFKMHLREAEELQREFDRNNYKPSSNPYYNLMNK